MYPTVFTMLLISICQKHNYTLQQTQQRLLKKLKGHLYILIYYETENFAAHSY